MVDADTKKLIFILLVNSLMLDNENIRKTLISINYDENERKDIEKIRNIITPKKKKRISIPMAPKKNKGVRTKKEG